MGRKRLIVATLASVAALTIAGLAVAPRPSLSPPHPREAQRIALPKTLQVILQREEMGPEDLPVLLELFRRGDLRYCDEVVDAILAIGEPESVKEVEVWISKKAARDARILQRMQQQLRSQGRPVDGTEDRPAEEKVKKGILLDHRWPLVPAVENEMPPGERHRR